MHNLLLFDPNQQPLPADTLDRIFKSIEGFREVRYNTPVGTPIEADYIMHEDFTTVRLNAKREIISISGTSDAAFEAALILQKYLDRPLRIIDTEYSFDLMLRDFGTLEELQAAIANARAS